MTEFVKPLLTEDAPEPPLLEPQKQEEAHQRARQSLAGQQGATQMAEAAGLTQKPVVPVAKTPEAKEGAGASKPKIAAKSPSRNPGRKPKRKYHRPSRKSKPRRTRRPRLESQPHQRPRRLPIWTSLCVRKH